MNRSVNLIPKDCNISIQKLQWREWKELLKTDEKQSWEVIIGSDCLFFVDYHSSLIELLQGLLVENGLVICLQPKRGGSLDLFISRASSSFHVELYEDYDFEVSSFEISINIE